MLQLIRNAYRLLSDLHKRKIVPLLLQLTLGSALDFFSLASFLPVILLIIKPQQIAPYPWLNNLYNITGFDDPVYVAVSLTFFALLIILIKTQVQVWITYRKAAYAYSAAADLASRAMSHHFNISYVQFTQTDYAREINRIANIPLIFANNIIIPIGTIISESIISLLLLISLAWYDYRIFAFLFILLGPVTLLYRSKRKKINTISQQLKTTIPLLLKYTLQAVESLLEIRIHRKENFFKSRFNQTYFQLEKTLSTDHTNSTSALRATELIATLCIGALLLYALLSRQSYPDTILLLTLYAGASFRIIPSVNRIFSAILHIRTNAYVVHELNNSVAGLDEIFEDKEEALPFTNTIEIRSLRFSYAGGPVIFKDASLNIAKHEKILITGKSGSGKTSLLLILLRFINELSGEIYIDGQKLETENTARWRKLFGYVSQHPAILDASILENIAFGIPHELINQNLVIKILTDLDLQNWINGLPDGLQTIPGEKGIKISGGQRQRLAIARALYQVAEILLLDEITNQLDKETRKEIILTLNKGILQNKSIIMVSHHAEETDVFDSIYELLDGQFVKTSQNKKQ